MSPIKCLLIFSLKHLVHQLLCQSKHLKEKSLGSKREAQTSVLYVLIIKIDTFALKNYTSYIFFSFLITLTDFYVVNALYCLSWDIKRTYCYFILCIQLLYVCLSSLYFSALLTKQADPCYYRSH